MSHYDTLHIAIDADAETVRRAWRAEAMRLHPDRNGGDRGGEAAMKAINEAYAVLRDPSGRAAYDRTLGLARDSAYGARSRDAAVRDLLQNMRTARTLVHLNTTRGSRLDTVAGGEPPRKQPRHASPPPRTAAFRPAGTPADRRLNAVRDAIVIGTFMILVVVLVLGVATGGNAAILPSIAGLLLSFGLFAAVLHYLTRAAARRSTDHLPQSR